MNLPRPGSNYLREAHYEFIRAHYGYLTQSMLAKAMGVSNQTVSSAMKRMRIYKYKNPSRDYKPVIPPFDENNSVYYEPNTSNSKSAK